MVLWWNSPINAWPLITSNSSYMVVLLQAIRKPRHLILISLTHANCASLIISKYFFFAMNNIDNCTWPAMGRCVPAILNAEIFLRPIHGDASLLAKKDKKNSKKCLGEEEKKRENSSQLFQPGAQLGLKYTCSFWSLHWRIHAIPAAAGCSQVLQNVPMI